MQAAQESENLGRDIPLPWGEEPELEPGLEIFFRAWRALDTCRSIGMESGPIPWDAVDRWCARHGIHGQAADDFWTAIAAMDEAARTFWKTNQPPEQDAEQGELEQPEEELEEDEAEWA